MIQAMELSKGSPGSDPLVPPNRRPHWLKIKIRTGENYRDLQNLVRGKARHTVCEEARCPNIYDCWERKCANLTILCDGCTY